MTDDELMNTDMADWFGNGRDVFPNKGNIDGLWYWSVQRAREPAEALFGVAYEDGSLMDDFINHLAIDVSQRIEDAISHMSDEDFLKLRSDLKWERP